MDWVFFFLFINSHFCFLTTHGDIIKIKRLILINEHNAIIYFK